ncbi:C1q and tumor necrosis factor protein 4 [Mactra antiquata]
MKTASYENEIQSLKQSAMSSANEIHSLKSAAAMSADKFQALKESSSDEIKALKTSSTNEIKLLKEEIYAMKSARMNSAGGMERRFVLGTNSFAEKPAFTASLVHHITNLGSYQTIIFDNVITNDLGAYNNITGIFTAPFNGTYFFTATVMSHSGEYIVSEICINGQSLVYMYSYDTKYEQGTNSVVLVLKAGDSVWVRHHDTQGSKAYGAKFSSFSGFML